MKPAPGPRPLELPLELPLPEQPAKLPVQISPSNRGVVCGWCGRPMLGAYCICMDSASRLGSR